MYTPLTSEFSGFVRAVRDSSYEIEVDSGTGIGEAEVFVEVYPGGSSSDPEPGPVCVPLSAGWELLPNESTTSGSSLTSWAATSSPRYATAARAPKCWSLAVRIRYEHRSAAGSPPSTLTGSVEAMAIFAVFGGIRPDDRGWVGGLSTPY